MAKKIKRATYAGALNDPIQSKRLTTIVFSSNGVNVDEEKTKKALEEEVRRTLILQFEKLGLLLDHYGIDRSDKDCWVKLAWHLAVDHVPGMQIVDQPSKSKRRPPKWTTPFGFELVWEVDKIRAEHRKGIKHAIGVAIKRNRGRWGSVNADRLEPRYYEARKCWERQKQFLYSLLRPS
jgi:hypothetical protein